MNTLKKGKLYSVLWVDISHENEWIDKSNDAIIEKIKIAHRGVVTTGYFVGRYLVDSFPFYVFSSGYDETLGKWWDIVIIPQKVILKTREL